VDRTVTYPGWRLNSKERERLDRLRRRADWLKQRSADVPEGVKSHDLAELSALTWAINAIEALAAGAYQPPPVDHGGKPSRERREARQREAWAPSIGATVTRTAKEGSDV
jgi:hypothetical protein